VGRVGCRVGGDEGQRLCGKTHHSRAIVSELGSLCSVLTDFIYLFIFLVVWGIKPRASHISGSDLTSYQDICNCYVQNKLWGSTKEADERVRSRRYHEFRPEVMVESCKKRIDSGCTLK
jgi:hypothetical protein